MRGERKVGRKEEKDRRKKRRKDMTRERRKQRRRKRRSSILNDTYVASESRKGRKEGKRQKERSE